MGQLIRFVPRGTRQEGVVDVLFRDISQEATKKRLWTMTVLGALLGGQFLVLLGMQFAGWYFTSSVKGCSLGLMMLAFSLLAVVTGGRDWPTRLFAGGFAALGAITIMFSVLNW